MFYVKFVNCWRFLRKEKSEHIQNKGISEKDKVVDVSSKICMMKKNRAVPSIFTSKD